MRFFDNSGTYISVIVYLMLRLLAATQLPFSDCDETYNYWEPAFHLLHHERLTSKFIGEVSTAPKNASALFSFSEAFADGILPEEERTKKNNTHIHDKETEISTVHVGVYRYVSAGKQTWEYSPQYGLRSWLYIWIYAFPAFMLQKVDVMLGSYGVIRESVVLLLQLLLGINGSNHDVYDTDGDTFDTYIICRCALSSASAFTELYLVSSISQRFGRFARNTAFLFFLFSPGFTQASISFLPSSFAMSLFCLCLGGWLRIDSGGGAIARHMKEAMRAHEKDTEDPIDEVSLRKNSKSPEEITIEMQGKGKGYRRDRDVFESTSGCMRNGKRSPRTLTQVVFVIFTAVCAALLGWPFAGLVAVPIALDVIYQEGFPTALLIVCQSILLLGGAIMTFDTCYYGRITFSPWNIIAYNIFGQEGRGPELYGVEPWNFFIKNLLLNFNVVFGVCLMGPVVTIIFEPPEDLNLRDWIKYVEYYYRHLAPSPCITKENRLIGTGEKDMIVLDNEILKSNIALSLKPTPLTRARTLLYGFVPFSIWFVFWMCIPHKEERFMSPAYPFLVLAGTLTVTTIHHSVRAHTSPLLQVREGNQLQYIRRSIIRFVYLLALGCYFAVFLSSSFSRMWAIQRNYNGFQWASQETRHQLSKGIEDSTIGASVRERMKQLDMALLFDVNSVFEISSPLRQEKEKEIVKDIRESLLTRQPTLCVGSDWYRYPSSFFLPQPSTINITSTISVTLPWRYCFLKTRSFKGALPLQFGNGNMGSNRQYNETPTPTFFSSTLSRRHKKRRHISTVFSASYSYPVDVDVYKRKETRILDEPHHEIKFHEDAYTAPTSTIRPMMNDLNREINEQYYCSDEAGTYSEGLLSVRETIIDQCDAIIDTVDSVRANVGHDDEIDKSYSWSLLDGILSDKTEGRNSNHGEDKYYFAPISRGYNSDHVVDTNAKSKWTIINAEKAHFFCRVFYVPSMKMINSKKLGILTDLLRALFFRLTSDSLMEEEEDKRCAWRDVIVLQKLKKKSERNIVDIIK